MTFTVFFISCQPDVSQPPAQEFVDSPTITLGEIEKLAPADKVACVDLSNDNSDDVILFSNGLVTWNTEKYELKAGIQSIFRSENSLLVASGFSREFRDSPKQVHKVSSNGVEELWTSNGSRNQIADISVVGDRIFLSEFTTGTTVQGGWLTDKVNPIFSGNMAVQQRPLPEDPNTLIVGRLYGDQPRSDGDLRVIKNGKSVALENFRGVRTLELTDINDDGASDLLVADGWHYQYASQGQARLSLFIGPEFTDRRTLAILDNEYTINHVEKHRDHPWILAQGSNNSYLLSSSELGWSVQKIGSVKETGRSTFCYDGKDSYILMSGNPATKIPILYR